jgi:hypothetical protein
MAVKPCEQCGKGLIADTSTMCGHCGKHPFPSVAAYGPTHDKDLQADGWRKGAGGIWRAPNRTRKPEKPQ